MKPKTLQRFSLPHVYRSTTGKLINDPGEYEGVGEYEGETREDAIKALRASYADSETPLVSIDGEPSEPHICADCGAEWSAESLIPCPECHSLRTAELTFLLPLLEAQHGLGWRAACFPARALSKIG